uniref:Uncharacterized protein n=1 Tax=Arundo donax TaxID=35708 RepID=A0A0A9ANR8_ARUDO
MSKPIRPKYQIRAQIELRRTIKSEPSVSKQMDTQNQVLAGREKPDF